MSLQGSLSIERMCQLAQVSRAGFYRSLQECVPVEEEMEVRSTIQQIVLGHRRRYGYRRVTAELRRRGLLVNHKRVARLMREDNLLAVQPRAFVVTTNSEHEFEVYLNLASHLKLTGINQLWVADITYIRLQSEFVYLAVILDGFSSRLTQCLSRSIRRSHNYGRARSIVRSFCSTTTSAPTSRPRST
jgi:transposase InsO family protein